MVLSSVKARSTASRCVAVGGKEAGTSLPGLGQITLEERGLNLVLPVLGPRGKTVCQSCRVGRAHGGRGETALGGVGEGAEHPGDIPQGAAPGPALGERSGRFTLEIQYDETVANAEHLAQVVVAVDSDLLDRPYSQGIHRHQPFAERARGLENLVREGPRRGGQGVVDGCQCLQDAIQVRLHRLSPCRDIRRRDHVRCERPVGRGGQGHVELARQDAQATGVLGVRVRQRPCEGVAARPLALHALLRGGEVIVEPGQGGRPGVALIRHEFLENGQCGGFPPAAFVRHRADQPGDTPEGGRPREEVRNLEIRILTAFDLPKQLQDGPGVVHDGGVALFGCNPGDTLGLAGQDLGKDDGRRESERPQPAGQGGLRPDALKQGAAEFRILHGIPHLHVARAGEDRDIVGFARAVGIADLEQGENALCSRNRRLVQGGDGP